MKKLITLVLLSLAINATCREAKCPSLRTKSEKKEHYEYVMHKVQELNTPSKPSSKKNRATAQRLIATAYSNSSSQQFDTSAYYYNNSVYGFIPTMFLDDLEVTVPEYVSRRSYSFNDLADKIYKWMGTNFLVESFHNYFDSNHNLSSVQAFYLPNYFDSLVYTYNSNNKVTQIRWWQKDSINAPWHSEYREIYSYNNNNLMNEIYWQVLDTTSMMWSDSPHDSIYYSGNNLVKLESFYYDSTLSAFVPAGSRTNLSYDANNNLLEKLTEGLDSNLIWNNSNKIDYTYDGSNHRITSSYFVWTGTSWVYDSNEDNSKDSLVYGAGILPISWFAFDYDTVIGQMNTDFRKDYTYNNDGQILSAIRYNWNNTLANWEQNGVYKYYYGINSILGLSTLEAVNLLHIHPSPAHNILYLDCEGKLSELCITDITGRVTTKLKSNIKQIDVSYFHEGIYLLQAIVDGKNYQTKFVKE